MRRFLYEQQQRPLGILGVFIPFGLLEDILIKGLPDPMVQAIERGLIQEGFHVMDCEDEVRLRIDVGELQGVRGNRTLQAIEQIEISARLVKNQQDVQKLEVFAQKIDEIFPDLSVSVVNQWDNQRLFPKGQVRDQDTKGVFLPKEHWYLTDDAINMLKKRESVSLEPYWDVKHWAIGYGHMLTHRYQFGERITQEKAEELLRDDLKNREKVVKDAIKVPLTLSMYGALISYAYNTGSTGFRNSDVVAAINNREYNKAAEIMKRSKVHDPSSKYHKGLLRRRSEESTFFRKDGLSG